MMTRVKRGLVKLFAKIGSQNGEDKILLDLLPETGKYLSIGAHHPVRFSNTFLLYLRGWCGINIDIQNKLLFNILRPRDRFIYGVINPLTSKTTTDIYVFKESALNTLSYAEYIVLAKAGQIYKGIKTVPNYKIDIFLKGIDLLDIDTEGYDLHIIRSMTVKPKWIVIENKDKMVNSYLNKIGYHKLYQTNRNGIYEKFD